MLGGDEYIKYVTGLANAFTEVMQEASLNFTTTTKRKSRTITTKEDVEYILSIDHMTASRKSTIMDLFGDFGDGSRFNTFDLITIPAGQFGGLSKSKDEDNKREAEGTSTKKNKSSFVTTVGLWIFNRIFIEPLSDILGYVNEPITKKMFGKINQKISYAVIEDKISVRQLKNFIENSQILMGCCSALSASHTEGIFAMQDTITKKKKELLSKPYYRDGIKNNDLVVMKDMENELIKFAKETLRDDPVLDMYESGARSTYETNFLNMYLMRSGLTMTDKSIKIITSSYAEGMDPSEYVDVADSSVGGPYARSVLTAQGGYKERLFLAATSHIRVLPKDSDCGTKLTVPVTLTDANVSNWYYSFMVKNGRLIELLPDIAKDYIGQTVQMRFSSLCIAKDGYICEHCAGSLFRRIGMENIGMASSICMSSLKNANMKSFHTKAIHLTTIDPEQVFSL